MVSRKKKSSMSTIAITIADAASWGCALILVAFILVCTFDDQTTWSSFAADHDQGNQQFIMGARRCDDIYVVGEGETLNTISDKCGDPFIVEQNPHIHDPDDVFPGLVIKITPSSNTRKLLR